MQEAALGGEHTGVQRRPAGRQLRDVVRHDPLQKGHQVGALQLDDRPQLIQARDAAANRGGGSSGEEAGGGGDRRCAAPDGLEPSQQHVWAGEV